jgi:hypothetical protein
MGMVFMPVVPALGRLRQEDLQFKASPRLTEGDLVTKSQKNKKIKKMLDGGFHSQCKPELWGRKDHW